MILEKKKIRRQIAITKRLYSQNELTEKSKSVINHLIQMPEFLQATTILLYHSLPDEVNTRQLIKEWGKTKELILPVVKGEVLELRRYTGDQNLCDGAFHIAEPTGEVLEDYQAIDLAIIPGVAFDRQRNRMGRGKGFYDRLLPQIKTSKIGICFNFQLLENTLPYENTDIPMDKIITEDEII